MAEQRNAIRQESYEHMVAYCINIARVERLDTLNSCNSRKIGDVGFVCVDNT